MTCPARVIGFCGLAGSGKTTAARALQDIHDWQRVSFAGPLKRMAEACGMTLSEMAGDLKETPRAWLCGKTPRQFLQFIGTEFGRDMIGPDFWVNCWRNQVDRLVLEALADLALEGLRIVADDVRFPNEAAMIRSLGGIVVRIDRPGAGSASGAGHASERMEFAPDLIIENTGDLAQFEAAIAALAYPEK